MTISLLELMIAESTKAAEKNASDWAADPYGRDIAKGLRRGVAAAKQAFSDIDGTLNDFGVLVGLMKEKVEGCLAHYRSLPNSLGEGECSALMIVQRGVEGLEGTLQQLAAGKATDEASAPLLDARLRVRAQIRDQVMEGVSEEERHDSEGEIQGHVFLSYVRENEESVRRLATALERNGIEVWMDRNRIQPGSRWRNSIRDAIENGAFFLACFSKEYESRAHSYMDEELDVAIDELRQYAGERGWFIPLRLNECVVPEKSMGDAGHLADFQWLDLYPDWDAGFAALLGVVADARRPRVKGGNNEVLDTEHAFEERMRRACEAWAAGGRTAEGLLSGKAFFAAQCWVYDHKLYDVASESYDEPIAEFVAASREFCGGDQGWNLLLLDHIACEACRETYRFENIRLSTKRMTYVCLRCSNAFTDPDEGMVG